MKTKFALVLSGGGFNGAFQVGALRYIAEKWRSISGSRKPMKFDIIAGVSAGAINGALVAMDELSLLHDLWVNKIGKNGASEIYTSAFIDTKSKDDQLRFHLDKEVLKKQVLENVDLKIGLLDKIGLVFSKDKRQAFIDNALAKLGEAIKANLHKFKSIADNSPLNLKLGQYLDRDKIKDTIFTCGFVSLNTGTYHSVAHSDFKTSEDFVNGVLASTAIPAIWRPVERVSFYEGTKCVTALNNVDGGIMNVSPLGDVIKLINEDPEECRYKIIVLNCNSGFTKYQEFQNKSIGEIAARAIYELTLTEVFNNDINHFTQINELVYQATQSGSGLQLRNQDNRPIKAFEAVIISPDRNVDMGSSLVANDKLITQRMAHGYANAQKLLGV
jgi:NTE family protein